MDNTSDQAPDPSAAIVGRRELGKASVRERILHAARACFTAQGINDADLAEIAQQAKVGRATLYRYFDGKDALQGALLQEDWDRQVAIFERLVAKPVLDEKTIAAWLNGLIRATAASLSSFPIYSTSQAGSMMPRLAVQRARLMNVLGRRFEGFSAPHQIECLLLLFQIEQFVVYAAGSADDAETARGVAAIVPQLLRRQSAALPPAAVVPAKPRRKSRVAVQGSV